ncbi:unnamed protein product, partial [Calicophoron daubneyi]
LKQALLLTGQQTVADSDCFVNLLFRNTPNLQRRWIPVEKRLSTNQTVYSEAHLTLPAVAASQLNSEDFNTILQQGLQKLFQEQGSLIVQNISSVES